MARILTNNIVINFGDKVWSTDEIINAYPWALVGVETEATFNGTTGGVDTYTNLNKDQFYSPNDYSQAITVGRMGDANPAGKLTINGGFYASKIRILHPLLVMPCAYGQHDIFPFLFIDGFTDE